MNPPLRPADDREALLEGLRDGTIDCIATDHSPRTDFEKDLPFGEAPFGMIGLETAVLSLHDRLVAGGELNWATLVRAFALRPRDILGEPGNAIVEGGAADFFVFDPDGTTSIAAEGLRSRSRNTPFLGEELKGAFSNPKVLC